MTPELTSLLLITAAAAAAPVLARALGRVVRVPILVFEIVLGLILGPAVLGWIHINALGTTMSNFGLAMLFFLAGNEIDFNAIKGRPLGRASIGWLISLALGLIAGILLSPTVTTGVFIGIALVSTALGTLMPVLRDAGELHTPFGHAIISLGAVGEFGPLLAISLFLGSRDLLVSSIVVLVFVVVVVGALWLAARGSHRKLYAIISSTLDTSGQFAVRLVIFVLGALAALSLAFGLDMLLGAFAAGVIVRVLLHGIPTPERVKVESNLVAVGFGFLVPIFFVYTGVTFNLHALVSDPVTLLMLPVFLVLLLIVRGLPATLAAPPGSGWRQRGSVLLFGATALPIIVAVTGIGVADHALSPGVASALVGAGMLSVLVFPLVALVMHRGADGVHREPNTDTDAIAIDEW